MKTTIEVSDPLLAAAKGLAAREGTTLRALVEEGLRVVLAAKKGDRASFRLRDAAFKGRGIHPDLAGRPWADIRDAAYEGRGG